MSDRYSNLQAALDDGRVKVPGEQPARQSRCGPWDEGAAGIHVCRKCGRLDPLDVVDDLSD